FGEAQRVLARPALRRLVQHPRLTSEAVQQYQPERAPDRRIRPKPGPEQVRAAVDAESPTNGAIHDDHERRGSGARRRTVQLEGGLVAGGANPAAGPRGARKAAQKAGKSSGRHPAITALPAALYAVTLTFRAGSKSNTAFSAHGPAARIRATRGSVGGTTGRPSVQ